MDHKDLCEHTRIRLIAAAVGHQQCTKTEANVIPIPGGDRVITIGTPAEVRGMLEDAAPASAQPDRGAAQVADAPQYENVMDHNGRIIGVRMTNADKMPSYAAASPASQPVAPLLHLSVALSDEDVQALHAYLQDFAEWARHTAVAPSDAKGKADAANAAVLLDALQKAARVLRAAGFCMNGKATSQIMAAINAAAEAASHPDDAAVDRFATAMKVKMAESRAKGRGGWDDAMQCPAERLQAMLNDHLAKGDPVDVGNFAMMLWNRGERTATSAADAKDAARWTKTPPTEQADYWNWDGDPDHAPMVYHVLWSGTAKKCFVSIGQYGIENAIWCDEFGGWWLKIEQPTTPSGDAAMAAAPSSEKGGDK
jgi:hypothetical protein